jgi:hypothetical protein
MHLTRNGHETFHEKVKMLRFSRRFQRPSSASSVKTTAPNTKGGEAPKGAAVHGHTSGCDRVLSGGRSPSGASPRLSPATRKLADAAPGHASWDAASAGVTRLHLSQSRDCTSRTGRSTGVTDARSRPGADCKSARRHRSRSVFRLAFRKASLTEQDGHLISHLGTYVN